MEKYISIQKLDLFLNKTNLKGGAIQVIKYVRPEWPEKQIKLKTFTDGITNRLIGGYLDSRSDDMVLIRVYGEKTELFIDRKLEVRNMRTMYKSGLSPPVYCTFENGICYGFSPGFVLDEKMVRDSVISRLISEMLARMHTIRPSFNVTNNIKDCPQEPEPCLFRGLRKFLGLIPSALEDTQQDKRFAYLLLSKL
jgi:ethanolamine kinase